MEVIQSSMCGSGRYYCMTVHVHMVLVVYNE